MAVDIPQGDTGTPRPGGSTNEPNGTPPKMPGFKGVKRGDQVRKGGWVLRWDGKTWQARRQVLDVGDDKIPTVKRYRERLAQRSEDGSRTGRANSPNPGGSGGGGGAGGGGGGDRNNELRGIPEGGKIWKVGNDYYLIYDVPKGDTQIAYKFRDKAEANSVSAGSGINVARTLTREQFRKTGAVPSGQVSLITNQSEHPWDRFVQDFRREAQVKPWLRDPDFMAIIAQSILENRQPTLSEIQSTDWYRSHTQAERDALKLYYGDRKSWQAQRDVARDAVQEKLIAAGYDEGQRRRVQNYFAREVMFGRLSDDDGSLDRAIEDVSNPYATGAERSAGFTAPQRGHAVVRDGRVFWRHQGRDYRLNQFEQARFGAGAKKVGKVNATGGFGQFLQQQGQAGSDISSVENYDRVREIVLDEAGPLALQGWGKSRVAQWAQRIAENPGAENDLRDKLRRIRKSLYPDYDDEMSYSDIAVRGRALFDQVWGQAADEKDPLFQQVLRTNDLTEASALLRSKGMEQGVTKVAQDAEAGAVKAFSGGGGVVDIGAVAG